MAIYLHQFLGTLMGHRARYWAQYGSQYDQIVCYLLRSYYTGMDITPSASTVKNICNNNNSSAQIIAYYLGPNGYDNIYNDLYSMIHNSASIITVHHTQDRVHDWLAQQHIPAADRDMLSSKYVATDASTTQVASYLADVMYYTITHAASEHT